MILQGFSPRVANLQSPRFSSYDSGYVTTSDVFANINSFFKAPAYTHDMATYAENTKAPFSVMELVSLKPTLLKLNATGFKGPALVLSGEYDWIVCGGYCVGEMEPSFDGLFGAGTGFETYIQPKTGHALNFATNATGSFTAIFAYLANHEL